VLTPISTAEQNVTESAVVGTLSFALIECLTEAFGRTRRQWNFREEIVDSVCIWCAAEAVTAILPVRRQPGSSMESPHDIMRAIQVLHELCSNNIALLGASKKEAE
jgi:hypothetical protein